jgi:hypothetical protein
LLYCESWSYKDEDVHFSFSPLVKKNSKKEDTLCLFRRKPFESLLAVKESIMLSQSRQMWTRAKLNTHVHKRPRHAGELYWLPAHKKVFAFPTFYDAVINFSRQSNNNVLQLAKTLTLTTKQLYSVNEIRGNFFEKKLRF